MKRVLFLTTYASPYRVHFFDALGEMLEVTVLFSERVEEKKHRSADWFVSGEGKCRVEQLKRRIASFKGRDLCADVIDWLKKPWDEIVLCGYSSPTVMLAMLYLRRKKIPFWLEVDGGLIREDSRLQYRFKRMLVGAASGWLSTGKATTDYLVHYGAKREKVREYPFSSLFEADILKEPVSRERKLEFRRELGMEEDKVILSIGQFIHRKGFDVLMKAAVQLAPDTGIYIVGGEPTEDYLNLCRELGLKNIHFEGFKKKEALVKYYQAADLFVLPTREDIWGLVINEAMAYGLPVVTTDRCVAGLELVENGVNGYLVPVEDWQILADSLSAVLHADREKMGAASLEKIRGYTIENMVTAHLDLLNDQ